MLGFIFTLASLVSSPDECVRDGWKTGDPIVFSDVAPCLRNEQRRQDTEEKAIAGDLGATALLISFYEEGGGDNLSLAEHWYRIYTKNNGGVAPQEFGQFLLRSKQQEKKIEGLKILLLSFNRGDEGAIEDIAENCRLLEMPHCSSYWYQIAAMKGNTSAMRKISEIFLASEDPGEKIMGLTWLLVARDMFKPGTYMRNSLSEKAANVEAATKIQDFNKIENFASILSASIKDNIKKE